VDGPAPLVSVYVDLPEGQRAIHASRSYQAVFDVWSRAQEGRVRLEDLCASIATELLSRHSYSSRASCELSGELFRIVEAPRSMNRSYESVGVWAYASARRSGGVETRRGVGCQGQRCVTACPLRPRGCEDPGRPQRPGWLAPVRGSWDTHAEDDSHR
jgi:GTP cyclohydrolase-4